MKKHHRLLSFCLALLLLLPVLGQCARALETEPLSDKSQGLIRDIMGCLMEENQTEKIPAYLTELRRIDPEQAQTWESILEQWNYVHQDMEIVEDVLPDGLPQDDSLAIVVMGYQLNRNGAMKPELLDRLTVAVRSAKKYPNAWIVCTGGATSQQESITEAGEMARWLTFCGIDEERIIIEDASYSTTENARNTCEILLNSYEDIESLAIITSDYHIRRSCLMFRAAALYAPEGELKVVGHAVCNVPGTQDESTRTKVWGLSILAGVEMPE